MENERMLHNKELIPSKTANKKTIGYLNRHLAALHKIYGDPKYNKADMSFYLMILKMKENLVTNHHNKFHLNTSVSICTPIDIITPLQQVQNLSQLQQVKFSI